MGDDNLHSTDRVSDSLASGRKSLHVRTINTFIVAVAAFLAFVAMMTLNNIFELEYAAEQTNETYRQCSEAAKDLQEASDFLTSEVRVYVFTGNRAYMDAYLEELLVTDRRGRAVQTIEDHLGDNDAAVSYLSEALSFSNELAERELYAMRLTAQATQLDDIPELVRDVQLESSDIALSAEEQRDKAEEIVLGDEYQTIKLRISQSVRSCSDSLVGGIEQQVEKDNASLVSWLNNMCVVIMLLCGMLVLMILSVNSLILWPLAAYTARIKKGESLVLSGVYELRYLADAYNSIYEENSERTRSLKQAAERDHLTGLFNRGAYDQFLISHQHQMALMLLDVDYFKNVNDTYGHDMGDAVLQKIARLLKQSFRTSDLPCRVGGDEFAVIVTDVTPELAHVVSRKLEDIRTALLDTTDGLPPITLSVGIAFSEAHDGEDDIYKAADRALYEVKELGRNGYAFYHEIVEKETAPV